MKNLKLSLEKDKLIKIGIGIIAGVILIIIILLIFHALTAKKGGYSAAENKLLSAAKSYYKDNETLLPQADGEQVSVDDVTLTSNDYMKSIAEVVGKDGVTCTGKVVVTFNNNRYRYTPLLDCGDDYKSQTLSSYISTNEKRVISGAGLYDLNGELVYRGEAVNNYITFSGHNYRIIKITDGHPVLILNERLQRGTWDDRYNAVRKRNDGINDYTVSRVKEALDTIYEEDELVSEDDKNLLSPYTLYIGKRRENDNYNDGSIEKSEYYDKQYLGLIPLYDYINASLDTNCNAATTNSCSNYNYLDHYKYNWWTLTADGSNNYRVYRISNYGRIEAIRSSSAGFIRPVIHLVDDALYVKGNGTEDNPYVVK